MSGLVSGLQNRLRRFESARHLTKTRAANGRSCLYFGEVQSLHFVSLLIYPSQRAERHYNHNLIRVLSPSDFVSPLFCLKELKLYEIPTHNILLFMVLMFVRSKMLLLDCTCHLYVLNASVRSKDTLIAPFRNVCLNPTFI